MELSLNKLNKEQKEAVTFGSGSILIVAGAGTGKTTAITNRIAYLVEQGKAKPEEILALTFTDKAAEEMEDRVINLLPIGFVDLWISTFHSFCERVLKEYALDIGLSPDFKLIDETQAWLLVRQNLAKFDLDYYRPLGNPTRFIRALLGHFSRCKDEGIYPEDYLNYSDDLKLNMDGIAVGSKAVKSKDKKELAGIQQESDRIKEVADAYAIYQKLLLDNSALDFGDLINYCLKLFQKRPNILEKYQQKFKYVLVDEFQDTNWAQYELVKLLAVPQDNLTVSADDDQSIYAWRGSSLNNVLQFRKDYPQAKEIILVQNYRSPQNILDLSYSFIQLNNPNRLECQISQEFSAIAKEKGVDLSNFKKIDKKLIAAKEKIGFIENMHFKTLQQETRAVIEKIIQLMKKDKESSFKDFAILVRANNHAEAYCRELERTEIPYQFLASKGLYSKPIILDAISYLKLISDLHESSAVFRVLNFPFFKISYEDIAKISRFSSQKGCSIYETLQQLGLVSGISQESVNKINFFLSLIQKHALLAREKNISEVFIAFLKDSGYLEYLIKREQQEGKKNFDLLNQFFDKIKKFEASQPDPTLNNFINQLDLEIESGEQGSLQFNIEEGPDTVKIMTIHGAKGLEFKYVFLVNLVAQRFPTRERKDPIEIPEKLVKEIISKGDVHLEEERRLFYVGMTRAKKGLFFVWADDYGGTRKKKPSRFLQECGLELSEPAESSTKDWEAEPFPTPKLEKYPIPSHFSYTQLAAFQNCPLQYKFAHILKIPRKGKASFSFGKTMHHTLEDFIKASQSKQNDLFGNKQGSDISHTDLLELYKKNWLDEWYEDKAQKEKYFQQGKRSLQLFFDDFKKKQPKTLIIENEPALEQGFNLKINNDIFIGKIDRIDKIDNGVEIIDYKTGKAAEKLNAADREQLLIYQMAAQEVLGLEPKKLTYYYLTEGKKLSFLGSKEETAKQKEKMMTKIEQIKKGDFSPTPGWQCQFCDFKSICEYVQK
ncbi:UvrD-helicase domain-containing protein [Candidatus Parcubacteria bacterium]|nr:UvrD-helicase domain-containing protein [Candidatus Parcubacteria bacterium]